MNFRNHYKCDRCGTEWSGVWPAIVEDDCPACGARHIPPYKTEDADDNDNTACVVSPSCERIVGANFLKPISTAPRLILRSQRRTMTHISRVLRLTLLALDIVEGFWRGGSLARWNLAN
jgi:hypothetical protein